MGLLVISIFLSINKIGELFLKVEGLTMNFYHSYQVILFFYNFKLKKQCIYIHISDVVCMSKKK